MKGRGPKDPGVAAPLAAAGCRGNRLLNASCVALLDRPVENMVCYFKFDDAPVVLFRSALATRNMGGQRLSLQTGVSAHSFSFLSQKTRWCMSFPTPLPVVGCPGHCGSCFTGQWERVKEKHHAGGAQHELMNCSGTTFWVPILLPAATFLVYLRHVASDVASVCHLHAKFAFGRCHPSSARRLWQLSVCRSVSPTCSRVGTELQRE